MHGLTFFHDMLVEMRGTLLFLGLQIHGRSSLQDGTMAEVVKSQEFPPEQIVFPGQLTPGVVFPGDDKG